MTLYLWNHQGQFLSGCSDTQRSSSHLPGGPGHCIFLETKWWKRVGVTISEYMCSPSPSTPSSQVVLSLLPETYILYFPENVS